MKMAIFRSEEFAPGSKGHSLETVKLWHNRHLPGFEVIFNTALLVGCTHSIRFQEHPWKKILISYSEMVRGGI